jgi:branched-chain amino acid transport system substrate-binding protein
MYRGIKFYEAAVKETKGELHREAVAAAMDHGVITDGPGGGSAMVPGHMHCKMNMYTAVCKVSGDKPSYQISDKADMVDPREC